MKTSRRRVLLVFVLSILPFLILRREVGVIQALQEKQEKEAWGRHAKLVSSGFRRASSMGFWVGEITRRLKAHLERKFAGWEPTPVELGQGFKEFFSSQNPLRFPRPRVWAMPVSPEGKTIFPKLLSGPIFSDLYQSIFRGLFLELDKEVRGQPNLFLEKKFMNRTMRVLGHGITSLTFGRDNAGRSFYAFFQGTHWIGAWEVVKARGGNGCIFLLLFPIHGLEEAECRKLLLKNWGEIFPGEEALPAFIPFATGFERNRSPAMDRRIANTEVKSCLKMIGASIRPRRVKWAPTSRLVPLASSLLLNVVETRNYRLLPCGLSAISSHLGVLVGPRKPTAKPFLFWITALYGMLLLLAWGNLGIRFLTGSAFPEFGIRVRLFLWFLGLTATPLAVFLGNSVALGYNLSENLKDSLDRKLLQSLKEIDAESETIPQRFRNVSRELKRAVQVEVSREGDLEKNLGKALDDVFKAATEKGFEPLLVFLTGVDLPGLFLVKENPNLSGGVSKNLETVFQGLSVEALKEEMGGGPAWERELAARGKGKRERTVSESLSDLQFWRNNPRVMGRPDVPFLHKAGPRSIYMYYDFIRVPGMQPITFYLMSEITPSFIHYLRTRLPRAQRDTPEVSFFAFHAGAKGIERIIEADPVGEGDIIAQEITPWGLPEERGSRRRISLICEGMPDFLLVSSTSVEPLLADLRGERWRIFGTFILIFLFLGGVANSLGTWLTRPIIEMTRSLRRIAGEELSERVGRDRSDELGEAGRILDTMTGWLQERKVMSRFVSPQVLEIVASQNLEKSCRGARKRVVVMVADIRSFTTLSESNPPGTIFALLNEHFEAMAKIIVRHGGIIDRFIGDAVQAVFPFGKGGKMADRALSAALEMMDSQAALSRKREEEGRFPYKIGIGLDQGWVISGVLGDPEVRLDLSFLGKAMKVAGRMESASKLGSFSRIVCSGAVRSTASPAWRFVPLVDPLSAGSGETEAQSWELVAPQEGFSLGPPEETTGTEALRGEDSEEPEAEARSRDAEGDEQPIGEGDPGERGSPTGERGSPAGERGAPAGERGSPPTERPSLGFSLACLVVWLVPLLLMAFWLRDLAGKSTLNGMEEVDRQLDEDFQFMFQGGESALQASILLQRWFGGLSAESSVPPKVGVELVYQEFLRRAERLRGFCPSVSWAFFTGRQAPVTVFPGFPQLNSTLLGASGTLPISVEILQRLFFQKIFIDSHFARDRAGLFNPPRESFKTHTGFLLGIKSMTQLTRVALGTLIRTRESGRRGFLFWMPFFRETLWERRDRGFVRFGDYLDSQKLLADDFLGIFFLFLDSQDLDRTFHIQCLAENMAARGCALAVSPGSGRRGVFFHPLFNDDPDLAELPPKSASAPSGIHGKWAVRSGQCFFPLEDVESSARDVRLGRGSESEASFQIIAARPLPPVPRQVRVLLAAGWLGGGLWFAIGLWVFFWIRHLGNSPRLRLRGQFGLAFLVVLVLPLAFGFVASERMSTEAHGRIAFDQRRLMTEGLQRIDEGSVLFNAWQGTFFQHLFNRPRILSEVRELEKSCGKPTKRAQEFLSRLMGLGRGKGLPFMAVAICGPGGLFLQPSVSKKEDSGILQEAFFQIAGQGATEKVPLGGSREKIFLGVISEEMREFAVPMLSPEEFSCLVNGPRAQSNLNFLDSEENRFIKVTFPTGPGARYVFSGFVPNANGYFHLANLAFDRWKRNPEEFPHLILGHDMMPAWFLEPPFFCMNPFEAKDLTLNGCWDILSPEFREVTIPAALARTTVWKTFGTGENAVLRCSRPGFHMGSSLLTGSLPSGKAVARLEREIFRQRAFLLVIFAVSLILALEAARRFLEPITALTLSAREVMKGRYDVRLSEDYGGEFSVLASSFNLMLKGISEGKLLEKFVSEFVQGAAQDSQRETMALAGELRGAVVLFAGLGGFGKFQTGVSPERLVSLLNLFLRRMSTILRNNGGFIDKFIGEKILAVFFPKTPGQERDAVIAALRASAEMQAGMEEIRSQLDLPLGIGLVHGPVLAGIMGAAETRREYTVIGDTVNLASRLADLACSLDPDGSKPDPARLPGGSIVIETGSVAMLELPSEESLKPAATRMDTPPIKGKTRAVETYSFRWK